MFHYLLHLAVLVTGYKILLAIFFSSYLVEKRAD